MHGRGQLSLEYLLLLLAGLAAFAILLPLLGEVYSIALFGLDSVNAGRFASSLQHAVEEMDFQADGSVQKFEPRPLSAWTVFSQGREVFISVEGPGGREKAFAVNFPNDVSLEETSLGSGSFFIMRKSSGKILLECR